MPAGPGGVVMLQVFERDGQRFGRLEFVAMGAASITDQLLAPASMERVLLQLWASTLNSTTLFVFTGSMPATGQGVPLCPPFDSTTLATNTKCPPIPLIITKELHGDLVHQDWHVRT